MKPFTSAFYIKSAALLAAAVMILSNIAADHAEKQFGLRLDMTASHFYHLTDTTKDTVSSLTSPVTITVLNSREAFLPIMREILDRYDTVGSNLEVGYIDPYINPAIAEDLKNKGYSAAMDNMVVSGPSATKVLALEDMFTTGPSGTVTGIATEQMLTSAILYVSREQVGIVSFSDGHGEKPSDALINLFEQNNYHIDHTALSLQDIQEDTSLFILAAPSRDFSDMEIGKLEQYLTCGGRILAFLPPDTAELLPTLSGYLEEWGIGTTNGIIEDSRLNADANATHIVPVYASHPINQTLGNSRIYPILPVCTPLNQLFIRQGTVTTSKILYSSPNATVKNTQKSGGNGPFTLALSAEKQLSAGNTARMIVIGSKGIYNDFQMDSPSTANRDFLLQAVNWCTETDFQLNIPVKSLDQKPITVLSYQGAVMAAVFIMVLPASVFITGICIRRRRKHL